MSINKGQTMKVSFMLFSIFFGAGNLIFPPFLGQSAGAQTPLALLGFLVTAVVLPVLGVVVIARFDGLQNLASKVGPRFAIFFSVLIYLSLGPGLAIPRAASVPYEMAVAPYLQEGTNVQLWMAAYSLAFFAAACWLAMTPHKMLNRFGYVLTPALLILIVILFTSFLFRGQTAVAPPQPAYESGAFVQGFIDGYQTMDTIAALNFGLVVSTALMSLGVTETDNIVRHTLKIGLWVGLMLALVYIVLAWMGMASSDVYPLLDNGAWTLRCIVQQLYGKWGAIVIASIFTLACLTTCVGLTTSISQYFTTLFPKVKYSAFVLIITVFSFIVCNQGLNTILSISVPVLNAIYPASIVLILLGLADKWFGGKRLVYSVTVWMVGFVSVVYALDSIHVPLGFVSKICACLPGYAGGFGWLTVALAGVLVGLMFGKKETA